MKFIKVLLLCCFIFLMSGCSITYDLDISEKGYTESVDVIYNKREEYTKYYIPINYGVMDFKDPSSNFLSKLNGITYYKVKEFKNRNLVNYSYKFKDDNIKKSNFANFAYGTFIVRKYDYDEDGKKDYYLLTTDDKFRVFDNIPKIDSVKVNIICHYEVISSNADKINKNVYTWYLDKDDIKPINMVYNPDKIVDYRSFLEKIMDNPYFSLLFIFACIFCFGGFIYLMFKKKSDRIDEV